MKKTRLFLTFTALALCAILALCLVSCNTECQHSYTASVTAEADCENAGIKTYTCTLCDNSYTEVIEPTGHNYTSETTAPNCTEQGYTTYTCACGDTYKDNYADALGHTEVTDHAVNPDCTNTGLTEGKHCSVCNTVIVAQTAVDALGHEYSDELSHNSTHHYYICHCGDKNNEEKHISSGKPTADSDEVCTACGYVINPAVGIKFNTLKFENGKAYITLSNSTEIYSFIGEITTVGGATYAVSYKIDGTEPISTGTLSLKIGDNTVYITEYIGGTPTNIYIVTVRRRPTYTVSFDTNGGTSVDSMTVEEDGFITAPATERPGYTFTSWDYDFSKPITEDTKITASWQANTNTKYTVEYYLKNLTGGYDKVEVVTNLTGTTDTTVTAEQKSYPHFTFDGAISTASGVVAGDGKLVLKLYYTRNSYTVSTTVSNSKGGSISGSGTYLYGTQITVNVTVKDGYSFNGIKSGDTTLSTTTSYTFTIDGNISIVADITPNTDTKYTVEYYHENLTGGYDLTREELSATTDTTVSVEKAFDHFTYLPSKSTASGVVTGDGKLVLKLYYTRNSYTVSTTVSNSKGGSISGSGTYLYGTQITVNVTVKDGYSFNGIKSGDTTLSTTTSYTFTIDGNISIVADITPNTDTKYTVEYYHENLTGGYDKVETVTNLTGTTDTKVTAEQKSYTHFSYDGASSTASGVVTGDGKLVLKLYYKRNSYAVSTTVSNYDHGMASAGGKYPYQKEITLVAKANLGYNFVGWYDGDTLLSTEENYTITITKKLSLTAKFELSAELLGFDFTLTETTCEITGVKDKTVTSIIVPDYVTSIAEGAFAGCSKLESIILPFVGGSKDATTASASTLFGYIFGTSSYDGGVEKKQYYSSSSYATYYIPKSLKSVTITSGNILYGAFYNCSILTNITIPDSVTSIGRSAFNSCTSLTSITIGNSVTTIGDYAFMSCSSLTSVTIPDSVTSIGDSAFAYCSSLTSVTIPDSVTSIGRTVFYNCSSLTSVTIGNSVTSIGEDAFENCSSLTNVHITDVAKWCEISFSNNYSNPLCYAEKLYLNGTLVTELIIPNGVTSIGDYAFYDCASLTNVTISDSVTSIGYEAFYNCSNLKNVTIGNSVTRIGSFAFYTCDKLVEVINNSSLNIGKNTSNGYVGYYALEIHNGQSKIVNVDDFLFITSGGVNYLVDYVGSKTNLTLPQNYKGESYEIYQYAFYNRDDIVSVTIPNSVTSIGYDSFTACDSLTSVTIGNGVKIIGSYAFYNCRSLTSVTIGSGVKSIANSAFSGCDSLTSVTIPDSVTSIGDDAFEDCSNLASVTIGNRVTSIGDNAFEDCSSLTSINYRGTEAQWNTISKAIDWDYGTGDYTIYYDYKD